MLFTPVFDGERIFLNRLGNLGFDKVITISWVVHFFGTQCMELDGLSSTVMPPTAVTFDLLT